MSYLDSTFEKLVKGEPLSFAEANGVIGEVMEGNLSEIKFGAWLTALRIKGETAEEIAGCAAAMAAKATLVECHDPAAVDIVGTGGDCAQTVNVSTSAAITAAAAGLTIAKHGNRAVSSKSGAADVLGALGVNIQITPRQMSQCLRELGIAFLFAPSLHPAMRHAVPVRKELKTRTVFNILGPLCNPAKVKRLVLGVYEPRLCRLMAEAAARMGAERLMVVHGAGGLDEISTLGPTLICELKDGQISEYQFDPSSLGVKTITLDEIRGGDAAANAATMRRLFAGELGPVRDVVAVNAAAALLVGDKAGNWPDALALASETIASGAAARKLQELVDFTSRCGASA